VSENYLALIRVAKWFFSCLGSISRQEPFVDPPVPQNKWTKVENVGWLKARGLDVEGPYLEIRARVKQFREQAGGPPPILPPLGGPVENVERTWKALSAMAAHLMQAEVDDDHIDETERHIKIFLSMFDRWEKCLFPNQKKPGWLTSPNFICLLNFPDIMREFGPLLNVWEGGPMGEAFLRLVKPEMDTGFRKNWAFNLLRKVMRKKTMMMLLENILREMNENDQLGNVEMELELENLFEGVDDDDDEEEEEDGDDDNEEEEEEEDAPHSKHKAYHAYKGWNGIKRAFDKREPLSVLQFDTGEFGCVMKGGKIMPLSCKEHVGEFFGCHYHRWEMDDGEFLADPSQDESTLMDVSDKTITSFCLLLPRLVVTGLPVAEEHAEYTVVDSKWREIQPDKTMAVPKHHCG
jgi:hypothetical protein